ncbi:flagellar basal body rod protein [Guptibacillus spartinae]|uniref:lmo0954 family membrane protein n=1 Tax=Guptibacillus spartinae TaxID=3025679 RepID=UPI00235E35A2|nr:flagellar basal body rod protein [Pseudalkalibacillus spartinae]
MKKAGLLLLGIIAAIVLLANLGSLVGMIISLGILYVAVKKFLQADSTTGKVIWGIIGVIGLSTAVANMPAILGLIAVYVLYVIYKKWDEPGESEDPFTNFEKQWDELKRS